MRITVLRLGHRKKRDVRLTTHCCLAARALLADEIVLSGEEDPTPLETVRKVTAKWGGRFKASYQKNWRRWLEKEKKAGAVAVHLTFYGLPLLREIAGIRKKAARKKIVVIIGAEKVPSEVYKLADFNIGVTSQPHSEVAALALFLHELVKGSELSDARQGKAFGKAELRINPMAAGKQVINRSKR
ncbi:MAG: tRNA (cytidine(56)-2'-O)-methyltransferase [Candidatus Micrarchaeota archaeon]